MKLLKIKVKGLELFKEEMVIDFYAEQRVSSENNEMVSNIFGNTYTNNTISFIGINASGKTTILKVVSFVIKMLNNEPINSNSQKDVLNHSRNVLVETYFYDEIKGYVSYILILSLVKISIWKRGILYRKKNCGQKKRQRYILKKVSLSLMKQIFFTLEVMRKSF